MIERLSELLNLPDADYWADVGCSKARAIIDEEPELVLPEIKSQWKSWTDSQQEHLAYILGEGPHPLEKKILLEMARSSSTSLAISAREALCGIPRNKA